MSCGRIWNGRQAALLKPRDALLLVSQVQSNRVRLKSCELGLKCLLMYSEGWAIGPGVEAELDLLT